MDVTQRTNSRTVIACLVPPEHFLTNKAPYLAFIDDDPRGEAACLAILNSLAFDWQARRFVEINLNFFILEGLRIPELAARVRSEAIGEVVLALNATIDGQTTAHVIAEYLEGTGAAVTSLAKGVPIGGELDYLDEGTISAAMAARKAL